MEMTGAMNIVWYDMWTGFMQWQYKSRTCDRAELWQFSEVDYKDEFKKITDEIGCYQIEFTLPSVLRNLDFGAFSVALPVIGLQIYTNGDFLFDFGFPYNMDFSRSFTVQAIIYGVPVLGSGGFYFEIGRAHV